MTDPPRPAMTQPPDPIAPGTRGPATLVTTFAVVLALLLVVVGGCDSRSPSGTPSVEDKIAESTIAGRERLRIGVYEDSPLMGYFENGKRTGFDIDIARGVAEYLGYRENRIDWVKLTTPERVTALQKGEVDIVVASFSITEERKKFVRFAGPYLVTTQEVIIPSRLAGKITELGHLRGSRVCVTGASTSKEQLESEGIQVETLNHREDCVRGILDGRFIAMSSDETILAGFRSQHPDELTIVDMPFSGSELLGIAVPHHDPALQDVIGHYLMRNYQDAKDGKVTAWQVAYNNNLGHWLGSATQPYPVGVPELIDRDGRNAG